MFKKWIVVILGIVCIGLPMLPISSTHADRQPVSQTNAVQQDALQTRDYSTGADEGDASATIIMYGDFQCILCARYARDLETLLARYPDDLRVIWRHFPSTQDKSTLVFQAAAAAAAQGRFWEMYGVLFANQPQWIDLSSEIFRPQLNVYAELIGMDVEKFSQELDDELYLPLVEEYREQAAELGIVGVPTLLINGELFNDRDDLYGLDSAVRLARLQGDYFTELPPMALEPDTDYQAIIETEYGMIQLDLFEERAPQAVNNFVFLTEQRWYDGNTFFLVIADLFAQTGDPSDTGRGYPGYTLPAAERTNGLMFDQVGRVAMAPWRGDLDLMGSQFFITLVPNPEWNGQYVIFGQVVEGLDVVQSLTERNEGDPIRFPNPEPGDQLISITITRTTKSAEG